MGSQKDILNIASFAKAKKRASKRTNRRRTARKQQNHLGSHSAVQGVISCMTEHGERADCSRDPVAVKAAIKLVRSAGHKVNSQMLGSNQECMTTHEEMADCSQNIVLNNNAELGEEEKVGLWRRRRRTPVARRRQSARRRRTPVAR